MIDPKTLQRQRDDLRTRLQAPRPKRDELRTAVVLPFRLPMNPALPRINHEKQEA